MKHYLETCEAVLAEVQSTPNGLTAAEANSRLETYGENKLAEAPKPTLAARFLEQSKNPMILV